MIYTHADQDDAGDTMRDPTDFFTHAKQSREPGVRVLEGESGNHERNEARQQDDVLRPLLTSHAHDHMMCLFAAQECFVTPDQKVVEQHDANHGKNHAEIELADPMHSDAAHISGQGRIYVHPAEGKFLGYARMALSARIHQVGGIDGGTWITGGQNIVHSVATGTIGDDL